MSKIITVGLDIAKHVFQVHGVDAEGKVIVRRKLRRPEVISFFKKLEPCLIGKGPIRTTHQACRGRCPRPIDALSRRRQAFDALRVEFALPARSGSTTSPIA